MTTTNNAQAPCRGGATTSTTQYPAMKYGIPIQVDCAYTPTFTFSSFLQRDATFTACLPQSGNTTCPASKVII